MKAVALSLASTLLAVACASSAPDASAPSQNPEIRAAQNRSDVIRPLRVRVETTPNRAQVTLSCPGEDPISGPAPVSFNAPIKEGTAPCSVQIAAPGYVTETIVLDRGTLIRRGISNGESTTPTMQATTDRYGRPVYVPTQTNSRAIAADVVLPVELKKAEAKNE